MTRPRGAPRWQTALSAVLLAAALPPWDLHFLVWFALVPWLALAARLTPVAAAVQGFWLALGLGLLVAHWVATAAHTFLELAWPLAGTVAVLFAALGAQPHWILWGACVAWSARRLGPEPGAARSILAATGIAFAACALELLVPRPLDAGIGYALHGAERLRQLADLGGVPLLTFAVVWVNALLWRLVEDARSRPRRLGWAAPAAIVVAILVGAGIYGERRLREFGAALDAPERSLRVGVVQGNVANAVRREWARGDDRAAERQLSAYQLPTEAWVSPEPPLDLVVWPETAFPGIFRQPESVYQRGRANKFDRQVLRLRAPIVFGAYDREGEGEDAVLYNALFAITPRYDRPGQQGFVQRYRKHELLPFAETIPGLSRDSWAHAWLPRVGFFGRGAGPQVFELETPGGGRVRVAPAICSESLSAAHALAGAQRGAELILNAGSDGWFGPRGEPQFHLAVARLRSVEVRRPQVRAANTGISALILPDGSIAAASEFGVATTLELDVPLIAPIETPFARFGDWVGRASIPAAAILLLGLAWSGGASGADRGGE